LYTPLRELGEKLRTRSVSPVELTRECLARIEKWNPQINAFITVTAEQALAEARAAEEQIGRGLWRGPLHGVPIGLKDIIDTAGVRTSAASALFADRIPDEDADIVRRLKECGAVSLGKQNLHEFAYGASTMVSHFGPVRNPWNTAHIAGGSSSGSAAAVAAGLGYAALGTDTAGSIRQPAALCGVVGLKPTYGRVSARGVVPLSWSLDHVGPIARCVADCAVLLQAIGGYDPNDPASVDRTMPDYVAALAEPPHGLRVGIPRAYFYEDLDPQIATATQHALAGLEALGLRVQDIALAVPTDRTLQSAESFAYHAPMLGEGSRLYQPETLRRIRAGENISAADYIRAQRELHEQRRHIAAAFEEVDVLVTPTTPILPPTIEELSANPELLRPREIAMLRNTRPVNVWGLPAISVPCGFSETGLPIGLQIMGAPWREDIVLRLAHHYEQASAWHKRQWER
jgi:aspartyl-tRNA(Asn)/glutamyl-tRNA(Gln) amidotransferase subunit A